MDNIFPLSSPDNHSPNLSSRHSFSQTEYKAWLGDLRPRTCLLVHWLAHLQAIQDPGFSIHCKAHRFAQKRALLGRLVDNAGGEVCDKTGWLIENQEFDLYVAYLMWLRFNEYVPRRFVAPDGRAKVLQWVRTQLGRPELTDAETVVELEWQIARIREEMGDDNRWLELFTD